MTGLSVDPAVAMMLVACLALLFGAASFHKLRDLRHFEHSYAAYELLPVLVRMRMTGLLPVLEAGVAAGVLFDASRELALGVGILLLAAYAWAIGINLRRGRRDLACGCGGPDERRPIAPWMIGRNLVIAALAALLLLPWNARPLEPTDAVTIGFGSLTSALVYLCLDGLLGRAGRSAGLRRT